MSVMGKNKSGFIMGVGLLVQITANLKIINKILGAFTGLPPRRVLFEVWIRFCIIRILRYSFVEQ